MYSVVISNLIDPTCPSITEDFTVGVSDFPDVSIVTSTPASCGQSNGSVEMSEQSFTYLWCNGATGYNPTNLPAGMCFVEITDPATGCTDFQTVIIEEENLLTAEAVVNNNPDCGVANGSVTINAGGGSGNYSYNWSPNTNTTATATGLASGMYSVTVTDDDAPGCERVISFMLIDNVPGAMIAITDPGTATCVGLSDATVVYDITYDAAFAQPPVIEILDENGVAQTNGSLTAGTYSIVVKDANGCAAGASAFEVTEPTQIDMDIAIDDSCPSPSITIVETI